MNPRTTPCHRTDELLELGRDRSLTDAERRALDGHAAGCTACAALVRRELAFRDALRAARETEVVVPVGFARRVTLHAREAASARRRSRVAPWGLGAALAAASCLAVVLVLGPEAPDARRGLDLARATETETAPTVATLATREPTQAASPASDEAEVGPLLWSDGTLDVVAAPATDPWERSKPAVTAVVVEYNF